MVTSSLPYRLAWEMMNRVTNGGVGYKKVIQPLAEDNRGNNSIQDERKTKPTPSQSKAGLFILAVFLLSLTCLIAVFFNFPHLNEKDAAAFKLPRDIDDAKELGRVLSKYKDTHFFTVMGGVIITYVFLQTFAIPGSIFLSILSGFLFPFVAALLLVCCCSAIGATFCYFLSSMVGHEIIKRWYPDRLKSWRAQVANHHEDLFNYIMFLRITPFLPNWFINIASPIIGVPVWPFFAGTFVGVAPPSFVFIKAGTTLYELTTTSGYISLQSVIVLAFLALLSLVPVVFRRQLRKKLK